MEPEESLVISKEDHMQDERTVTTSLIDFSDGSVQSDKSTQKTKLHCDWAEAVTGWQNVVPYPQYVPHNVSCVIKKKKPDKIPEWQRSGHSEHFTDLFGDNPKAGVRCIGDDFENFPIPPWKANVEQGTYRYVPNNGFYRTIKFLTLDERRDWFTVTKKQPEKVSMSWQNKRFQKELKRQLKREFATYHHQRQSPSLSTSESVDLSTEKLLTERSEIIMHHRRIRSTQSQNSTNSNSQIVHTSPKHVDSPVRSAPLSGQLLKSASDLYIANFTHRITALEEELRRDSRIARKNHDDALTTKNNTKPKNYSVRELTHKQREKESTSRPVIPMTKEVVSQETFTIRSVGTRDLRPTEKITLPPAQGSKGGGDKMAVTQLKYTTMAGGGAAILNFPNFQNEVNIDNGELDKTLHSYKLAIETTKQSLIHTLSASKIQRRKSGKGFVTPATIAIGTCENISTTVDNTPDKVGKNGHPRGHNSTSQKETLKGQEKKAPMTGILPEIAGKRLEVPPTGHRWL